QINSVVRINQLGYAPNGIKVAVWGSLINDTLTSFSLIDAHTNKELLKKKTGKNYGEYGPFVQTYRLDFSTFTDTGSFYIKAGSAVSPIFRVAPDVYKGT